MFQFSHSAFGKDIEELIKILRKSTSNDEKVQELQGILGHLLEELKHRDIFPEPLLVQLFIVMSDIQQLLSKDSDVKSGKEEQTEGGKDEQKPLLVRDNKVVYEAIKQITREVNTLLDELKGLKFNPNTNKVLKKNPSTTTNTMETSSAEVKSIFTENQIFKIVPPELFLEIFSHLPLSQLPNVMTTCRFFCDLITKNSMPEKVFKGKSITEIFESWKTETPQRSVGPIGIKADSDSFWIKPKEIKSMKDLYLKLGDSSVSKTLATEKATIITQQQMKTGGHISNTVARKHLCLNLVGKPLVFFGLFAGGLGGTVGGGKLIANDPKDNTNLGVGIPLIIIGVLFFVLAIYYIRKVTQHSYMREEEQGYLTHASNSYRTNQLNRVTQNFDVFQQTATSSQNNGVLPSQNGVNNDVHREDIDEGKSKTPQLRRSNSNGDME